MINLPNRKILKSTDIGDLLFGQMHSYHNFANLGINIVNNRLYLRDTPHLQLLVNITKNRNEDIYLKYLKQSWEYYFPESGNTAKKRNERQKQFLKLFDEIKSMHDIENPIKIVKAPDGNRVIIDGNHRASIAYAKCLDLPYQEVGTLDYIRSLIANDSEFYGTKKDNLPYQSIYYGDQLYIKGRREDVLDRFKKIRLEDIRGKTIADLGSNLTINGMLAWHYGANEVTGYEYSKVIATAALRLSTLFNSRISMKVHDMGVPLHKAEGRYDTVFCFSLYAHVNDKTGLEDNIKRITKNVLYFEGHEKTSLKDYDHIFRHFKNVELIGYNEDGIHSKKSTRPFFRCVK